MIFKLIDWKYLLCTTIISFIYVYCWIYDPMYSK